MCGGAKWKRENVPDHKFDFINTRDFYDSGFFMRLKYLWLYLVVLKSFLVYLSDIFSAVTMLTTKNWSNEIFKQCQDIRGCVFIPFTTGKWLFVSCILVGFLLLAYESRKAKIIIQSRDISSAFTNVLAHDYYSLRSYDHFCLFEQINNSTQLRDDIAFFVFFIFKSWKRLILADSPRQAINALTLYAVYLVKKDNPGSWYDVRKYFKDNSNSTSALTVSSFFTVAVCAGSMLLLFIAAICYIPLLFHIRGNLKEFCCHIVDKRISEIIKKKGRKRYHEADKLAKKEAKGDYSHLKNKKGELIAKPLPQPTLPKLSVDDDDASSMATRVPPSNASTYNYTQDYSYNAEKSMDYPPMPAFNPYSHHPAPGAPTYNPSFSHEDQYNYPSPRPYDDSDSIVKLGPSPNRQGSPYYTPSTQSNRIDPVNVYQGRPAYSPAPSQTRHAMPPPPTEHERQPSSGSSVGLAYDDGHATDHQTQPTHPAQYSRYANSPRGGSGYDESGRGNYKGGYAA